jgi:sec-independent protein translocase protein TatA
MAGLGWQELVIVLVIIMIIFGAGKLPEIAKSLGQGVKEFRQEAQAPVVPASTQTSATAQTTSGAVADAAERIDVVEEETVTVGADSGRAEPVTRDAI